MILMFAKKSFIASIHRPSNRKDLSHVRLLEDSEVVQYARFASIDARPTRIGRAGQSSRSRCNGHAIRYGYYAVFCWFLTPHHLRLPPGRPDFIDPRLSPVNPLATRLGQMMSGGP
jgi:hypothetical protein